MYKNDTYKKKILIYIKVMHCYYVYIIYIFLLYFLLIFRVCVSFLKILCINNR